MDDARRRARGEQSSGEFLADRDGLDYISLSRDGRFLATDIAELKGNLWISVASPMGGNGTSRLSSPAPYSRKETPMAQVTSSSRAVIPHLVTLSKVLAEAIGWVSVRNRKLVLELPDEYAPRKSTASTCCRYLSPRGNTEAQILIAILKKMSGEGRTKR